MKLALEPTQTPAFISDDDRWSAVVERDKRADGVFVYAVTTTGVFCRPGCSSRRPNRDNVRFFDYPQAAEAAGFPALQAM